MSDVWPLGSMVTAWAGSMGACDVVRLARHSRAPWGAGSAPAISAYFKLPRSGGRAGRGVERQLQFKKDHLP